MIVGSEKDPQEPKILLTQFYQAKFSKYTMFKSQITAKSHEGIVIGLNKWKEHAEKNGHLKAKHSSDQENSDTNTCTEKVKPEKNE